MADKENIGADILPRYSRSGIIRDETKLTNTTIKELRYSAGLRKKLNKIDKIQKTNAKISELDKRKPSLHFILQNGILFRRGHESDG